MHWSREAWIGTAAVVFALLMYYILHWVGLALLNAAWAGHGLEAGSLVAVLLGPIILLVFLALTAVIAAIPAWGVLFAMAVGRFLGYRLGVWDLLGLSGPEGVDLRSHLGGGRLALRNALEALLGLALLVPIGLLLGGSLIFVGGGQEPGVIAYLVSFGLGFAAAWGILRLVLRYWARVDALLEDLVVWRDRAVAWLEWIGAIILRRLNGGRIPADD